MSVFWFKSRMAFKRKRISISGKGVGVNVGDYYTEVSTASLPKKAMKKSGIVQQITSSKCNVPSLLCWRMENFFRTALAPLIFNSDQGTKLDLIDVPSTVNRMCLTPDQNKGDRSWPTVHQYIADILQMLSRRTVGQSLEWRWSNDRSICRPYSSRCSTNTCLLLDWLLVDTSTKISTLNWLWIDWHIDLFHQSRPPIRHKIEGVNSATLRVMTPSLSQWISLRCMKSRAVSRRWRRCSSQTVKVGTHEGTSPCDQSLQLVPWRVYTKGLVAGTSPW